MNDLLAVNRGEYQAAGWFFDVEGQFDVKVDSEVSEPRFQRFMQLHSFIQQSQMDVKMRYLQIGCALLEIEREKLYLYVAPKNKTMGYSTFYGFCQEVFGFSKSSSARMVAVAREFCGDDGGVKVEYLNFSYSQLAEMLPIEEKYRPRITVQCSTRDIRRLAAYYKDNVPKVDGTAQDDLEAWNEIYKKEQERKNAKKNAITFIPAKKEAKTDEPKKSEKKAEPSNADDFDGDDERDVVTPTEKKKIPFETLRKGLLRQLSLLVNDFPDWKMFCDYARQGLEQEAPAYITKRVILDEKRKEAIRLAIENDKLKKEISALKSNAPAVQSTGEPARGKLYLKNAKERKEWLEKYQSWGVWLDVPEVSKKFYRYDFENGDSLVIEESTEYRWNYYLKNEDSYMKQTFLRYAILDKNRTEYDSAFQGGASGIVDWLSKHAKEI